MRFSLNRPTTIATITLLAIAPAVLLTEGRATAQTAPYMQAPASPASSTDSSYQAPTTPFPGSGDPYQATASPVATGDPCISPTAAEDPSADPQTRTYLRRPGCVAPPPVEPPPASVTPPSEGVVVVNTRPMGFGGAYVGAGIAAGVTNGGQAGTSALFGGNIQGRIAPFENVPVSARAAILFGGNNSAIMPMLTYDIPVAVNTNVYVGGGYSFVEKNGQPTPIGNKSAPVVVVGAESSVTRDIVLYGDAKVGIQPYYNTSASSLSLQAGMGYRF